MKSSDAKRPSRSGSSGRGTLIAVTVSIIAASSSCFSEASIIVPKMNGDVQFVPRVFNSLPASFGTRFEFGKKYVARLQLAETGDPYLCDSVMDDSSSQKKQDDQPTAPPPHQQQHQQQQQQQQRQQQQERPHYVGDLFRNGYEPVPLQHVLPPEDGLPVAILVKRGKCTFEEKAKNALSLLPSGVIKYIIIYDNEKQDKLVPMSATDIDMHLGLVFVTLETGKELLRLNFEQPASVRLAGGFKVFIDSSSNGWRSGIYGDDPKEGMIATLSGFLIFVFCCGFSLLCVQAGFVHVENGFIFVGNVPPEGWNPNGTAESETQDGSRLVTTEEVNALPSTYYLGKSSSKSPTTKGVTEDEGNEDDETEETDEEAYTQFNNHTCAVCLEDYCPNEHIIILPCKHSFHSHCITPWLTERSSTCPLCKTSLVSDDNDEDNEDDDNDTEPVDVSEEEDDGAATRTTITTDPAAGEEEVPPVVRRGLGIWWRRLFRSSPFDSVEARAGQDIMETDLNEPLLDGSVV